MYEQLKAGDIAVTCLKIQDETKNLKSKHRGVKQDIGAIRFGLKRKLALKMRSASKAFYINRLGLLIASSSALVDALYRRQIDVLGWCGSISGNIRS